MSLLSSCSSYESRRRLLLWVLKIEALCALPLVLCSLIAGGTANVGFNIVLTALLNVSFNSGAYMVVEGSRNAERIGFVMGSSSMMALLNFTTGIYWGQLSRCRELSRVLAHYSCNSPRLYGFVALFSMLIFATQFVVFLLLYVWRDSFALEGVRDEDQATQAFLPKISTTL